MAQYWKKGCHSRFSNALALTSGGSSSAAAYRRHRHSTMTVPACRVRKIAHAGDSPVRVARHRTTKVALRATDRWPGARAQNHRARRLRSAPRSASTGWPRCFGGPSDLDARQCATIGEPCREPVLLGTACNVYPESTRRAASPVNCMSLTWPAGPKLIQAMRPLPARRSGRRVDATRGACIAGAFELEPCRAGSHWALRNTAPDTRRAGPSRSPHFAAGGESNARKSSAAKNFAHPGMKR